MGEKYYLRLLLTVVRGAQSYEHLRTVNTDVHPTLKAACISPGLLEHDGEWISTFREGSLFCSGFALRQLFPMALCHETISNPFALWEEFRDAFCDDLPHLLASGRIPVPPNAQKGQEDIQYDYGLFLLEKELQEHGKSLREFELPSSQLHWQNRDVGIPSIV